MRLSLLLRAVLGCAAVSHASALLAQPASPASSTPPQAPQQQQAATPAETRAWLLRIHDAASQRNYQGTLVISAAGGAVSSSRIAHYCEGTHRFERIEVLDGEMRRVFRHDDVVKTVWPGHKVAVVEQRDPRLPFPALLQAGQEQLTEHYELRAQGLDRVAGYDAQVFLLRPRDEFRFAQRLWAEKASGLLLRADTLGTHGEVLESAAFSEVAINVKPRPDTVLQPMQRLEGYKVIRPVLAQTQLEAEGWQLKPVAGFRQISCVKRPLDAPGTDSPGAVQVVQSIFSDGMTHVSVFIEPFDAERHQRALHTVIGATHTLMARDGDHWITVMGDVPPVTLKAFAQALKRR